MTRGLLIAAPRSGGGKTTLTLGLMRAFRQRGVKVAGLKSGPDYIDPAFHKAALGRDSFNLDTWAMDPALLEALAGQAAQDAELVLAEGSMGLFDGVPAPTGRTRRLRRCRRRARLADIAGARRLGAGAIGGRDRQRLRLFRSAYQNRGRGAEQDRQSAPSFAGQGGHRGGGPDGGRRLAQAGRDRPAGTSSRPRASQRDARAGGAARRPRRFRRTACRSRRHSGAGRAAERNIGRTSRLGAAGPKNRHRARRGFFLPLSASS